MTAATIVSRVLRRARRARPGLLAGALLVATACGPGAADERGADGAIAVTPLPAEATSRDPTSPWWDVVLENGLHATLVDAPLMQGQAFFTVLPVGLLDDGPGQAQFVHLVEHLAVRSTDAAAGKAADGVLVNGETLADSLRLEALAPVEAWKAALQRHARWLGARAVDPEVLAAEQHAIAAEEAGTVAQGYTHKWALAAWNQVVRHGLDRAAVHGDVAGADESTARQALARYDRPDPGLRFVSVGPVDRDEVLAALRETLGTLSLQSIAVPPPSLEPAAITTRADHVATWDLDRRHWLEWYPVPGDTPAARVAADALAQLVTVRLQQRGGLAEAGVVATASADLVTPEGRWILISASLPEDLPVETLRAGVDAILTGLDPAPEAAALLSNLSGQLGSWPDFAALRRQVGDRPGAAWIEAQQALFLVYAQLATGLSRDALAEAYRELEPADVLALARRTLVPGRRSTLLLEPGGG